MNHQSIKALMEGVKPYIPKPLPKGYHGDTQNHLTGTFYIKMQPTDEEVKFLIDTFVYDLALYESKQMYDHLNLSKLSNIIEGHTIY